MEKFMGIELEKIDWIERRNNMVKKAEQGALTPIGLLAGLRASFYEMSDAEKLEDLRRAYLEANEVHSEDLQAEAGFYDDLMAGNSNLGR